MNGTFWKPGRIAALALIAIVAVGAWITSGAVMVVSAISVNGSSLVPEDDVVKLSGINHGQAMLFIDTATVAKRIESNRFLKFISLDRQYPSHVIINVKTRKPVVALDHMGSFLIADIDGVVMAKYDSLLHGPELPVVIGLELPESRARLDACILDDGKLQARAAFNILSELIAQGVSEQISELNVSELDNLYLVTVDALKVLLGDDRNLPQKITLANAVLLQLPQPLLPGGVLDVTAVNKADYIRQSNAQTGGL